MKTIAIFTTAALLICGAIFLTAFRSAPSGPEEIARDKADAIMTQTYGTNWYQTYLGCVKNRTKSKAMSAAYEVAIGFRHTK